MEAIAINKSGSTTRPYFRLGFTEILPVIIPPSPNVTIASLYITTLSSVVATLNLDITTAVLDITTSSSAVTSLSLDVTTASLDMTKCRLTAAIVILYPFLHQTTRVMVVPFRKGCRKKNEAK
jgi:hypothetical protein